MAALATTDDVAVMLQRDLTTPEEAAVAKALDYASGAIRRYCRQTISLVEDDAVILVGAYGRKLILPERPVVDVTAVAVAGLTIGAGMFTLVGDELWNGPQLSQVGNAAEFASGGWGSPAVDVAVTYSHGFAEIPPEIEGLCVAMVQRYAANPSGVQVSSETIGSYSYAYSAGVPATAYVLTLDDKDLLSAFRRTWFQ